MRSSARIADHPLHPMLIVVPAGAFVIAFVCDLAYLLGASQAWWQATFPVLVIGVVGGLVAAIPGVIDLVNVAPRQGATGIGVTHGVLNLALVGLSAFNGWIRWGAAPPETGSTHLGFWLSLGGLGILAVSGWLGWQMVYKHRIGVEDPAWVLRDVGTPMQRGEGPREPTPPRTPRQPPPPPPV